MLRRQVQVSGRCLQILVSEQQLDGAQIGPVFEQMRRPAVTQGMRRDALADAGLSGRLRCDVPDRALSVMGFSISRE